MASRQASIDSVTGCGASEEEAWTCIWKQQKSNQRDVCPQRTPSRSLETSSWRGQLPVANLNCFPTKTGILLGRGDEGKGHSTTFALLIELTARQRAGSLQGRTTLNMQSSEPAGYTLQGGEFRNRALTSSRGLQTDGAGVRRVCIRFGRAGKGGEQPPGPRLSKNPWIKYGRMACPTVQTSMA